MPTNPTTCRHCGDRPPGKKTGGLCNACSTWKNRHHDQLPDAATLGRRRARDVEHAAARYHAHTDPWLHIPTGIRTRHSRGT